MTVGASSGIPDELLRFLASGQNLDYSGKAVECGATTLLDASSLRLSDFSVDSDGHDCPDDPHADEPGYYLIPAVSLLATAEGHIADGLLVWIPTIGCFGTWDSDHWDLVVFPNATWNDIVADPARFLNAQWDPDTTFSARLKPWEHAFTWHAGRPPVGSGDAAATVDGDAAPADSTRHRFVYLSPQDGRRVPVARHTGGELPALPPEPSRLDGWTVPTFHCDLEPRDYLANDAGLRLCSGRLRAAIDESLGRHERVQWLPCEVTWAGATDTYFALHLESYPDVLDREASITVREGFVVKAVVDASLAEGVHVVGFPGAFQRLLVSEATVARIRLAGCTGVDVREVPMTHSA